MMNDDLDLRFAFFIFFCLEMICWGWICVDDLFEM